MTGSWTGRFGRGAAVVVAVAGFALAAQAASFAAQLRFTVQPGANDKGWTQLPGVKYQKAGECVYSASPTPSTTWPVSPALVRGGGKATAPLFNPGFAKPDGTYDMSGGDDGFNTLFYPATAQEGALTIVCRGSILANGKDVTKDAPGRVVSATLAHIAQVGPPGVIVTVDPARMGTSTLPPAAANAGRPNAPPPQASSSKPAAPAPGSVYRQGSVVLQLDHGVNMITGAQGPASGPGVTVAYYAFSYSEVSFGVGPGVFFADPPDHKASYAACLSVKAKGYKAAPAVPGISYCLILPDGRMGMMTYENSTYDPKDGPVAFGGQVYPAKISYVIWNN